MDNYIPFTVASFLLILTPGPGNLMAISRGLSQGKKSACLSAISSGCGILIHVAATSIGLTALLVASALAFLVTKICGALYLCWLGYQAIRSRSLISFDTVEPASTQTIMMTGFLTAALSPKIGMFMLAFIPQFIPGTSESVGREMAVLGTWFAVLTTIVFCLMGIAAHQLVNWLAKRPRVVSGLNIGAGAALIVAGISLALTRQ